MVRISARDKITGREQHIISLSLGGLSKDQIEYLAHEYIKNVLKENKRKEDVEERKIADSAAYRAEKSLSELGDRLQADLKSDLESKLADVRSALSTDDVARIRPEREALEQAFYKASESI